jgi:2-polyprenyl-3-methyl-5-hydroxy-6-metoxy-1,4-benzoquinol methylase
MIMQREPWTKEQVEAFLRNETVNYQRIELPYGLATGGVDRSRTRDLIFRDDIKGKTFLDVGCSLGYFCLEALKRGAARAVGWDVDADRVRQAGMIASLLGSKAEYCQRDVEDIEREELRERFDVVICLNVLHHVIDPIATLDKLIELTREKLILEVASLGARDRKKLGVSLWHSWVLSKLPTIVVGGQQVGQTFFFSPEAFRHLLQYQRTHFSGIDIFKSEFKDRFMVVATRRRVNHVVVVAGPTSAGKSTLIEKLLAGQIPDVAQRLAIPDLQKWPVVQAREMVELSGSTFGNIVLHYDFLRPSARGLHSYEKDEALHVLRAADRISIVTLLVPPERLVRQLTEGEINHKRKVRARHRDLLKTYSDPARVVEFYRRWFAFCERFDSKIQTHLIVEFDRQTTFHRPEEWEIVAGRPPVSQEM